MIPNDVIFAVFLSWFAVFFMALGNISNKTVAIAWIYCTAAMLLIQIVDGSWLAKIVYAYAFYASIHHYKRILRKYWITVTFHNNYFKKGDHITWGTGCAGTVMKVKNNTIYIKPIQP